MIDTFRGALLNARVHKNGHRWRQSVYDEDREAKKEVLKALKMFKRDLKRAWETDREDPKSFPLNTSQAFWEINKKLAKEPQDSSVMESDVMPPPRQPPSEHFSDLADEETIEFVFELQNDENYKNALKLAASGGKKSKSTWRKILLAVDAAHFIKFYSPLLIPKPRVHYLHRELLKMTEQLGIGELTQEGIAEFFDDICPCGIKHKPGTIRKLKNRSGRIEPPASGDDFWD